MPINEKQRLQALHDYHILDTPNEEEFDYITEIASIICDVPISLISLIDNNRQWFKSKIGLDVSETSRELAFCQYAIMTPDILEVEDATKDERFRNNDLVTGKPDIRFYAGCPLIDSNGYAMGTLCVIDRKPKHLTSSQKRTLELLGKAAIRLITERRKKQELDSFEKLFKLSNDLICIAGTDGFFKKINPAFEKLGWKPEVILSTSVFELVHPDDLAITKEEVAKLSDGHNTINFTHRLRTKDNQYRIIEWVATPEPLTGNLFAIGRDISSERLKEVQLKISEKRLRSFFENSQGLMCTHDLKGNFLSVNSAGAGVLGYTTDELIQLSLFEIVPKQFHPELKTYLSDIITKGRSKGQMITLHKNGSFRTWMYNNILEQSIDNESYIIGNAIDITDRYALEKDLQHTKGMLEQTNKVARVGGWELDFIHQTINWTNITKEIHGVEKNFKPDLHTALSFYKDDYNRNLIKEAIRLATTEGKGWDLELQIVNTKNEDVWVRAIGDAEFSNGECVRLFGTFQDIDKEKKAQLEVSISRKLLKDVLNAASEVSFIATDKDGLITVFNTGAEKLLGYSAEEMIGKQTPALIHSAEEVQARKVEFKRELGIDIDGFRVFVHNAEIFGSEQREWTYIRKDGLIRMVSLVVTPIRNSDTNIIGYLGIATDITVRKEIENALISQRDELKMAKLQAEEASIAKSEFLANMSHEIRTPLNGVIGFTDLLLKTNLNETQQQYLSIVNQSANTLLGIINDILDFSKIEAGKLELDIEKCDLYQIISRATDVITYQIQKKGLEMLLNIPYDLPRFIWTDSVRLNQIIINLLSNASKFTQKGEVELKVERISEDLEKIILRFSVRDTGIGIKHDKQDKIFEAFSQEDASTTKEYGGTGLGLAISNKLLGLMGSKLELNSTLGIGSTFYFDIALKAEHGVPVEWENIEMIKRVLIVDDNDNNRMILKHILLLKQIESVEAKNGFEAFKILSEGQKFDVLLIDYHMPFMDGLQTIRLIRESSFVPSEEQPVILLHSSSDDEKLIKSCEELKINHRLIKPIKIEGIFNMLSHLYRKSPIEPVNTKDKEVQATSDPITVLLADDNAVNMLLGKTIIKRIAPNSIIVEVKNGQEAIKYCENAWPDIIFMDIQMPVLNGYEATIKIRQMQGERNIPIIALTAGNVKSERERCLKAGMDDFVVKPIVENDLLVILNKWLPDSQDSIKNKKRSVDKSHFSLNQIKEIFGEEETVLDNYIELIKSELKKSLAELENTINNSDLHAFNTAGHKLHGTALASGLNILAIIASEIENLEALGENKGQILFGRAVAEIDLVLRLMDKNEHKI